MNNLNKIISLGVAITFGATFNVYSIEVEEGQQAQMQKRQGMGQGRGMGKNMPTFSDFDLNKDGKILEDEFYDARNKRIAERAKQGYQMRNLGNAPVFSEVDTNGDGQVNPEEFKKHLVQCGKQKHR